MDTGSLGKWAWIIGLALLLIWGLLAAFGVTTGFDATVASVATLLAFLGGLLYIGGMKDKTGFFIATLILWAVATTPWTIFGIEAYLQPLFMGAAAAALAASAGALVMVVYEWVMP